MRKKECHISQRCESRNKNTEVEHEKERMSHLAEM